jgi:hypothetical protein
MNTRESEQEKMEQERLQGQPQRSARLSTADLARAANRAPENRGPERETNDRSAAHAEGSADAAPPLFPSEVTDDFRSRWMDVQTGFVDKPREAVEQADELVAEAIKRLAESFSQERSQLEAQWARDGDVSTEDLRIALQRYRSFFERLLHL